MNKNQNSGILYIIKLMKSKVAIFENISRACLRANFIVAFV